MEWKSNKERVEILGAGDSKTPGNKWLRVKGADGEPFFVTVREHRHALIRDAAKGQHAIVKYTVGVTDAGCTVRLLLDYTPVDDVDEITLKKQAVETAVTPSPTAQTSATQTPPPEPTPGANDDEGETIMNAIVLLTSWAARLYAMENRLARIENRLRNDDPA